jgi:hypothetical protein
MELSNILGQQLVSEYAEDLEEKAIENFKAEEAIAEYERIYEGQKAAYEANATSFDTALDSVSDSSFVLYGLENFGFVYNILLPFSASQNLDYTTAKNKYGDDQEAIYKARRDILSGIQATDLREAWFCADNEDENYAYKTTKYYGAAAENPEEKYLFFENNMTNPEKYESLGQYAGNYAYNGTVAFDIDGNFEKATPKKLGIDAFIDEFKSYIADETDLTVSGAKYDGYVTNAADYSVNEKNEFTDYSEFMYYTGKVEGLTYNPVDYFVEGTDAYKAVSAVNELMFAYSTDTGCLNTYMGYVVSPFKTSFVKEFEYAAQYAIRELGVGGYVVCPSDYGWHIIYVSHKLDKGSVYGDKAAITEDSLEQEGSFFKLYYESLKSSSAQNYQTMIENNVLVEYNNGSCVTLYTDRYEDLLSIDE